MNMIFTAAKPEQVEKAFHMALFAAQEQIRADCNYYCREDTGMLIDSAQTQVDGMELKISWNTPYARRVYYTGTPSTNVNPHASLMWAEVAHTEHGDDWAEILSKGMSDNL